MRTHETDAGGIGTAAKQVAEHARALVQLELELARLELKRKLGALGLGVGLAVAAAVVALFAVGFLLATAAAALATVLSTWLALLIVGVVLLVLAGGLGLFGLRLVKQGAPPVPEEAIREAKRTSEAIRSDGGH
jgi:hypothetical protein